MDMATIRRAMKEGKPVTSLRKGETYSIVIGNQLKRVRLVGVHFDTSKCFMRPSAINGMKQVVTICSENTSGKLLVIGHTDTSANDSYNLDLSVERAESIMAFLKGDVDSWGLWYNDDKPYEKRWGNTEDMQMVSALPCTQTITGFQEWSNTTYGSGLKVDGVAGPKTRKALIYAYMALEGTTLPDEVGVEVHGCGEYFPMDNESDSFGSDGVHAQENRRVEMLCFSGDITPAVPGKKAKKNEPEYPAWIAMVSETIDISGDDEGGSGKIWMEFWDKSGETLRSGISYKITGDYTFNGTTDGFGRVTHEKVPAGDYTIALDGCVEETAALVLPDTDDEPQIRYLA